MGTALSIHEGLRGPLKWLAAAGLIAAGIVLCGSESAAKTVPYFQIQAGIMSREVVEEDPSISG
ncbi:MAG TPA: hypothetical protein VLB09_04785, partial [Nitrospiria bacterium]|nr:hypothetical protein [Nitrospiria bacterium]